MDISELLSKFRNARNRLMLLDYDGTLVNFSASPEGAVPGERLLLLLKRLSQVPELKLVIITGRESKSIDSFLGHLPIDIIAEHGATMRLQDKWISQDKPNTEGRQLINTILEKYVRACPGSFIEKKLYALTWHYRMCDEREAWTTSRELIKELEIKAVPFGYRVIDGNKVVEVAVEDADKGAAAKWMISQGNYDFVLSIGDDKTDEDIFKALREFENCYTVKVGDGATLAKHKLVNVPEVLLFLEQL